MSGLPACAGACELVLALALAIEKRKRQAQEWLGSYRRLLKRLSGRGSLLIPCDDACPPGLALQLIGRSAKRTEIGIGT